MNYNLFFPFMDKNKIEVVFEIGSRDCLDAIELYKEFNSIIYSFECNPDTIDVCKENIKDYDKINLVQKAISNENGFVNFYPFDLIKYNNPGASSLLKINFSNRSKNDPDYCRENPQKQIMVESITLDNFIKNEKIKKVDLICMDLQGSEFLALMGFKENILNTKYIITETCFNSTYDNGTNFQEIYDFLKINNFKYKYSDKFGHDVPSKCNDFFEFNVLFENEAL